MSDGEWIDYGPGVRVRRLGTEGGAGFYLVRMDAGAAVPPHRHPQAETFLVLDGEVELSRGPAASRSLLVQGCSRTASPSEDHGLDSPCGALLLVVARPDYIWLPPAKDAPVEPDVWERFS